MKRIKSLKRIVNGYFRQLSFPFESYQRHKNCIFIHIPKTAGTSVLKALGKNTKEGRYHLPWYVYKNANPNYFDNSFKFCFVRNPWDRAYSAYEYLKSGANNSAPTEMVQSIGRFNDFNDFVIKGLSKGFFRSNLLFLPQSDFILDYDGNPIVDFMGRFENLDDDFIQIAERLKISPLLDTTNVTPKKRANYRDAYTQKSMGLIADIYSSDIRFFNYEF